MLLQTNSYIVPAEQRVAHAALLARFRQTLARLGCDSFEAYEQSGPNWSQGETTGRFIQIMRFRDRQHQLAVQAAEREDQDAQTLISEFCELINFPYQQQHGFFAVGFYIDEQAGAPADAPPDSEDPSGLHPEPGEPPTESTDVDEEPELAGETDEYAEQELDAIIAEFGEPDVRETLNELERESASPAPLKIAGQEQNPAAPEEESGSGIGRVLDAGLLDEDDDLDVAMPAELLEDESEEVESHIPDDGGHTFDEGNGTLPRR